jgi:hypothetical protein
MTFFECLCVICNVMSFVCSIVFFTFHFFVFFLFHILFDFILLCLMAGNMFAVKTSDSETYIKHWLSFKSFKKYLNFEVRSCENARLVLSMLPFTTPLYEVVLGSDSNRKSRILRYNPDDGNVAESVAEEDTAGILDCFELRRFSISWESDKIKVSLGSSAGKVVLDWLEDQRHIEAFSVGLSTGSGSAGDWKFSFNEGKLMYAVYFI